MTWARPAAPSRTPTWTIRRRPARISPVLADHTGLSFSTTVCGTTTRRIAWSLRPVPMVFMDRPPGAWVTLTLERRVTPFMPMRCCRTHSRSILVRSRSECPGISGIVRIRCSPALVVGVTRRGATPFASPPTLPSGVAVAARGSRVLRPGRRCTPPGSRVAGDRCAASLPVPSDTSTRGGAHGSRSDDARDDDHGTSSDGDDRSSKTCWSSLRFPLPRTWRFAATTYATPRARGCPKSRRTHARAQ